jgi:hypothetical protein
MIFCKEVQYYTVNAAIQHRDQHILNWNYEITVVQEIHISRLELQRWPLYLLCYVISFSKICIWDLGLRFG